MMSTSVKPFIEQVLESVGDVISSISIPLKSTEQQKGTKSHSPRILLHCQNGKIVSLEFTELDTESKYVTKEMVENYTRVQSSLDRLKKEAEELLNDINTPGKSFVSI